MNTPISALPLANWLLRAILAGVVASLVWLSLPVIGPVVSSALWRKYECKLVEAEVKGPSMTFSNPVATLMIKYAFTTDRGTFKGNRFHVLMAAEAGEPEFMEILARELREKLALHCYANPWYPAHSALSRNFNWGHVKFRFYLEWTFNKAEVIMVGLGVFLIGCLWGMKTSPDAVLNPPL